jgi:hypothetical protein
VPSIFSTPELVVGLGLSEAAAAAFEPKVEVPKQGAWFANPVKLPDVGLIAALVAGGKVTKGDGQNMAARLGYSHGTLDSLVWLAQNRSDFPMMLRLWRRFGAFDANADATLSTLVDETLAHEQLDWSYRPWLRALKTAELPGIGDVAFAVVRGILPSPAWVPVAPPTTTTNVKRFPQVDIDPVKLAAALGYSEKMLKLMVGRSGLSMAPVMAASAYYRGILAHDDYLLAIAEGDLRTEWGQAVLDVSRQIPTADQMVEHHLRGWVDAAHMYAGTARHGMSKADTDLIYQTSRRPLTVATITKALARGGVFDTANAPLADPYDASVHEANLGPEWYDLAKHMRYTYPSAFVLRQLLKDGAITEARAAEIFKYEGWEPTLADEVAKAYASGAGGAANPHVGKAQTQLWNTMHTSYKNGEATEADLAEGFTLLAIPAGAQTTILQLWNAERALVRKQLTPAQLKKAYAGADLNPTTNAAWTLDEVLARLVAMGYSHADAVTFMEE